MVWRKHFPKQTFPRRCRSRWSQVEKQAEGFRGSSEGSESLLVAQSCLTLCNPMDCGSPSSSVHGILQARILEWVAIPFSRESSQPRDWTQVSSNAGRFFTVWVTREALSEGKAEAIIWGHWSALYLLFLQPSKPSLKVLELMVEVLTFSFQIKDI